MSNIELRYAHLGFRDTPARSRQRAETADLIAEIQATQEATPAPTSAGHVLQLAERYRTR